MSDQTNVPFTCSRCGRETSSCWIAPGVEGLCSKCFEETEKRQRQKRMGWVCPVCGRGLAPFTSVCPCFHERSGQPRGETRVNWETEDDGSA